VYFWGINRQNRKTAFLLTEKERNETTEKGLSAWMFRKLSMFTTTVSPRFGDVDGLGHINNTVLAVWFELGRNPFFRFFEPNLNLSPETWPLIMAHTDYDFVDELFFQYDVEIRSYISRIGNKSFTVYQEAWQEGRFCVKGSAVVVHYNFKKKETTLIPEEKKKFLEKHLYIPEK
jgi:acyl-CoA thioester hydrolase